MPPIIASRPNSYTGSPLNRVDNLRADEAWVEARRLHPDTGFVPTWRGRTLFTGLDEGAPRMELLPATAAAPLMQAGHPWALLGLHGERALFALDLGRLDDPAPPLSAAAGRLEDLRALAGTLLAEEAAILAEARGLMHWRTRHGFCGNCGAACLPRSAGWALNCSGCGAQHFPRTDPAVIMLVHRGNRALLGHSTRFPTTTMYSTLAGFVEPGESLEEAVAREVLEESAVRTGRVSYHSSQPWPFPGSIMLGFYAEALTEEITIDPTELRDARWFSRDELRNSQAHGFSLPRADSIARRLIEDWVAAGDHAPGDTRGDAP